jgi:hypothetical protein
MTQPIKLAAKIAKVMEAVGYVAKTGTNSAQGYKFVQASAVADKVREQLVKFNVSMTPTQHRCHQRGTHTERQADTAYASLHVDTHRRRVGRDHLVPVSRHWRRLRRQGGI